MKELKSNIFKEGRFLINLQNKWLIVKKLFYEIDKENKHITHLRLEGNGDIRSCEIDAISRFWLDCLKELNELEEQKDRALVVVFHETGDTDLTVVTKELSKEMLKTWNKEKIDSIRQKGDMSDISYII